MPESCSVWVFRAPQESLHEATCLRHSFNVPVSDDADNVESFAKTLRREKLGTTRFGLQQVQEHRTLASELESEEKLLHDNMHLDLDLRTVMKPKSILLFTRMLETRALLIARFARSCCAVLVRLDSWNPRANSSLDQASRVVT